MTKSCASLIGHLLDEAVGLGGSEQRDAVSLVVNSCGLPRLELAIHAVELLANLVEVPDHCEQASQERGVAHLVGQLDRQLEAESLDVFFLQNATKALTFLTAQDPGKSVEEGGVKALANVCSRSNDVKVLESATASLSSMSSIQDGSLKVVSEGTATKLIPILGLHASSSIRRNVATILGRCSTEPANRQQLIQEGAGALLAEMCHKGDEEEYVIREACKGVAHLAVEDSCEYMMEQNLLPALVELCGTSKDVVILEHATRTLASFASVANLCQKMVAFQLITAPLVQLCGQSEGDTLHYTVLTLAYIARSEGSRTQLVQQGSIKHLLKLCTTEASPKVATNAVSVLYSLANVHEGRLQIAWQGGLKVLAEFCNNLAEDNGMQWTQIYDDERLILQFESDDESDTDDDSDYEYDSGEELDDIPASLTLARNSAKLLSFLASDVDVRASLVNQMMAVQPLAWLCAPKQEPKLLLYVMQTVQRLAQHDGNRPHLLREGIIPRVLDICNQCKCPVTVSHSAKAIAQIVQNDACVTQSLEEGVLENLLRLCIPSTHKKILVQVVKALVALGNNLESRPKLVAEKGVAVIYTLCTTEPPLGVHLRRHAVDALSTLAQDSTGFTQLIDIQSIPFLVTCFSEDNSKMTSSAALALSSIARQPESASAIMQVDVLPTLVQLCEHSDEDVVASAATFLASFSKHEGNRPHMVTSGALQPLVELCCTSDHVHVLRNSSEALAHLSRDEDIALQTLRQGALAPLLDLYKLQSANSVLLAHITTIMSNFVQLKAGRPHFIDQKVLAVIMSACDASNDAILLRQSAELMSVAAAFKSTRKHFLSEGGLQTLLLLSAGFDTPTLEFVADAFDKLSQHDHGRTALTNEDRFLPALTHICDTDDKGTALSRATKTMVNLASHKTTRDLVAGHVCTLLLLCTPDQRSEALRNLSKTFDKLAAQPSTRECLLQQEAVKAIVRVCDFIENSVTLTHLTCTLSNLATDPKTATHMMAEGVPGVLVGLCASQKEQNVARNAILALHNLSVHDGIRLQLVEDHALAVLVGLCIDSSDDSTTEYSCGTLSNLARDSCSRKALLAQGVKSVIAQLASNRKHVGSLVNAISLLSRLNLQDNKGAEINEEMIDALMKLCESTSDHETALAHSGPVFNAFCKIASVRQTLADSGAVQMIVEILNTKMDAINVLEPFISALGHMALEEEGRREIMEEYEQNGTETIVNICGKATNTPVARAVTRTLANLASHHETAGVLKLLVEESAVKPLLQLISESEDNTVVLNATDALAKLAVYDQSRSQVVEDGVMWNGGGKRLGALCVTAETRGFDHGVLTNVTKAIAVLALDANSRLQLVQEKVVKQLVQLSLDVNNKFVLANIADALKNLARHEGSRTQIVQDGALEPLMELCTTSENTDVLKNAAAALANLALNESVRRQMVDAGTVKSLGKLCGISHEMQMHDVLLPTIIALRNISRQDGSHLQFCELGMIEKLIELCESDLPDKKVWIYAADIATNIANDETGVAGPRLVTSDGMRILNIGAKECLSSAPTNPVLLGICQALGNLCDIDHIKMRLVEDGAVALLAQITLKSTDKPTITHAALAVSRLAMHGSSYMGEENARALEFLMRSQKQLGRVLPKALIMPLSKALGNLQEYTSKRDMASTRRDEPAELVIPETISLNLS